MMIHVSVCLWCFPQEWLQLFSPIHLMLSELAWLFKWQESIATLASEMPFIPFTWRYEGWKTGFIEKGFVVPLLLSFFFKEGGISGFYRGLIPTIIGMAPYAGYYHTINIRIFWCSRFNNTSADVILFIFSILQDFLSSPSVLWRLRDSLTFQSS